MKKTISLLLALCLMLAMFAGCGTQSSFESGLACALAAVIGAAGTDCPERINTPCIVATKENLKEAWELSFRMELPSEVAAALAK